MQHNWWRSIENYNFIYRSISHVHHHHIDHSSIAEGKASPNSVIVTSVGPDSFLLPRPLWCQCPPPRPPLANPLEAPWPNPIDLADGFAGLLADDECESSSILLDSGFASFCWGFPGFFLSPYRKSGGNLWASMQWERRSFFVLNFIWQVSKKHWNYWIRISFLGCYE